jgi:uncharacterized protein
MLSRNIGIMENTDFRALAVITGASSGIGRELALCCAANNHDVVLVADQGPLEEVAERCRAMGVNAFTMLADLATAEGVRALCDALADRPVDALLANAGHGLGHAFLDQDFDDIRHVIGTNITGTVALIHHVGRGMRERRRGRILITGSIAGLMPGSFQAVYNASKAFIDSFALALRNELRDSGVTVTCLMPGPTDTAFFERANMLDTQVGTDPKKDDPADVARTGFEAMMNGEADVVAGWKNKLQATLAHITPAEALAERHRKMAEPGSDRG